MKESEEWRESEGLEELEESKELEDLEELEKSGKMEEGEESEESEELEEVVKSGFGGSRGVGLDCNEGESRRNSAKQAAVVLVSL